VSLHFDINLIQVFLL